MGHERLRGQAQTRRNRTADIIPSAETTSKVVAVPKSITMQGPPCRTNAAAVFTTRSAPTSSGRSDLHLHAGHRARVDQDRSMAEVLCRDFVDGACQCRHYAGNDDVLTPAHVQPGMLQEAGNLHTVLVARFPISVLRRQEPLSSLPAKAPTAMFVLPTSTTRST